MQEPVAVGLIGAGPWAELVHAPMLAAGPETRLAGVWARRPEAAAQLAASHGTVACASPEELYADCEAVAFCVPPDVQAELAIGAAKAGKTLLLEKPIAADLAAAERFAEVVGEAGVNSMILLTWRYNAAVRTFIEAAQAADPIGGRAHFISGGILPGSMFATPWRIDRGPLLDLGPHVLDLLDVTLGRITGVHAHGDLLRWVGLLVEHEGGLASEASFCCIAGGLEQQQCGAEIYGPDGWLGIHETEMVDADTFVTVARELATLVREGGPHPLDIQRGLHLQRLLEDAETQLR
jgi:predicted dehydrogenase